MQSKKRKKIQKKRLNEQALYNHFIREGYSKFIAEKKVKMLVEKDN
jgi:hypothetical protein